MKLQCAHPKGYKTCVTQQLLEAKNIWHKREGRGRLNIAKIRKAMKLRCNSLWWFRQAHRQEN